MLHILMIALGILGPVHPRTRSTSATVQARAGVSRRISIQEKRGRNHDWVGSESRYDEERSSS
jgi:hypothetical protein